MTSMGNLSCPDSGWSPSACLPRGALTRCSIVGGGPSGLAVLIVPLSALGGCVLFGFPSSFSLFSSRQGPPALTSGPSFFLAWLLGYSVLFRD